MKTEVNKKDWDEIRKIAKMLESTKYGTPRHKALMDRIDEILGKEESPDRDVEEAWERTK